MPNTITVSNYLGGCPTCGANDGCVNVNGGLVCYCKSHKVSWSFGQDLLIGPLPEPDADRRERNKFLEGYEDVLPVPEGTWPADPQVRIREGMDASQKRYDEEQRQERLY
jgi:hypothetical protein